jgi:hypothetical protein
MAAEHQHIRSPGKWQDPFREHNQHDVPWHLQAGLAHPE